MMIPSSSSTRSKEIKPRFSVSFFQGDKVSQMDLTKNDKRRKTEIHVIKEEDEFCNETNMNLITNNYITTPNNEDNDMLL
jgi:hypothetical protein